MILSLDLSTACCGWAKYERSGILLDFGEFVPDDKVHNFFKIKELVDKLSPLMDEANSLVVEGIFLNTFTGGFHNVTGFEILARLSGAVINSYLNNHKNLPMLYKAVEARKLVGIKGTCQKAEIQLWAIRTFNLKFVLPITSESDVNSDFDREETLENFDSLIDAAYAELKTEQIKRPAFKSRMDKISKLIEETTGIGEDKADAILLGLAYVKDNRIEENTTNNK